MSSQKYQPLDQDSSNASKEDLPKYAGTFPWTEQKSVSAPTWRTVYALCALLGFAIASNILFFVKLRNLQGHVDAQSFVGLEKNLQLEIPHDDRSIDDPMWESPKYDYYAGWVAIDNDVAKAKGVPTSMNWPWDKSKGIYVFHGYHSLHCVYVLREALRNFRDDQPQTWAFGHVTHCLHVLREDTICSADDTPRYTGHLHAQENQTTLFSGVGQNRMCRDWDQLREYAITNSACYRRPDKEYIPLLDRYKYCPDGSKPWEEMEE